MKEKISKPKNEKAEKVAGYILLCFFAAFGPCFFVPMDIFLSNADEIAFPLKPLAAVMWIVTLSVFAVLFLVCVLTKGKANDIFRAAVFGISLGLYIQGNFLAVNMGTLDGSSYEVPVWKAAVNAVIWLLILATPFVILIKFPKIFNRVVSYIPAAIILIQILALGASAYLNACGYPENVLTEVFKGDTRWINTTANLNVYGKDKDLIVIVADMYDSFCFDSAVADEPESVSEFDGFTYYTNTVGRFSFTPKSFSYILTANGNEEYRDRTFFETAAENYRTNYYCDTVYPPASVLADYSDNIIRRKITLDESRGYANGIYKISLFRCVPEVFKPLFRSVGDIKKELELNSIRDIDLANDVTEYPYYLLEFYNTIPRELKTVDEDVFKLIYMNGIHSPRNVTRDLESVPESAGISPEESAVAVNKILNEYLRILKDNGIYDSCEIIIMADHGIYNGNKFPLLMYKPAHQTETGIKISNAPISYEDIFPTLVMLAGGEPNGRTIFDIGEGEKRARYFEQTNEYITDNIKEDPQNQELVF